MEEIESKEVKLNVEDRTRKKILVCIDKFKGTLTQKQAGRVLEESLGSLADVEQV